MPLSKREIAFLTSFDSASDYDRYQRRNALIGSAELQKEFLSRFPEPEHARRSGYKVRRYRSGEVTGGMFLTGRQGKFAPPPRSGKLETSGFTIPGRQKIRRAVENTPQALRYFITLTFAPAHMRQEQQDWQSGLMVPRSSHSPLNDDGTVNHQYAKEQLKRFLNTCSQRIKRQNQKYLKSLKSEGRLTSAISEEIKSDELLYLWVAEIQEESTGNIHFHIMWNKFINVKWLKQIWGQASNSVNAKQLNNTRHAANYIRGYIQKDENLIQGNRYFICHKLRTFMKPDEKIIVEIDHKHPDSAGINPAVEIQEQLQALAIDIQASGGRVLDFGFSIPAPRKGKKYKNRKGKVLESFSIEKHLSENVLAIIEQELDEEIPF